MAAKEEFRTRTVLVRGTQTAHVSWLTCLWGSVPGDLGTDHSFAAWAIGQEDRGTYSIQVCLFFDQNAPEMVSQAPADPEGKCPFKYYDKACPEPAS